jgi:hypothetical protein
MKSYLMPAAVAAVVLSLAASAQAQLLYSFEGAAPPDGFGPNGGGVTISQTATGATLGAAALNYSVVGGATFVGALTSNIPAALASPLAIQQIQFDYTLPLSATGGGPSFGGAFASLGVTIFGASQPTFPGGQLFGLQAQFADFEVLEGKAPGQYTGTIDLLNATNQADFSTKQSFNQIFGSGANQQIPTGFQFFLNKSGDAPITFQIDNVRLVQVPEPASLLALSSVGGLALHRRRRAV